MIAHYRKNQPRPRCWSRCSRFILSCSLAQWAASWDIWYVSCFAPATRHASLQILFQSPTPAKVFETATAPPRFDHSWQGAKFALVRNCIWLSKIGSGLSVFNTFDVETCFAPQQRPLFNISKVLWGGHFLALLTGNVLRTTTSCTFSTSQLPKVLRDRRLIWKRASRRCAFWTSQLPTVVRHWCVLYILTSTCDLRQNGVHLSTS